MRLTVQCRLWFYVFCVFGIVLCVEEQTPDEAGMQAIKELHKQMDDDQSGTVDLEESLEFVKEELEITEKERLSRRQQTFHKNNDNTITVQDLWTRWVEAKERNWTIEDTLLWLENVVELPQYSDSFLRNAVDGKTLPRIASANASFLSAILGVQNPVHRRKLQLKAMDVVLFGYKHPLSNTIKDIVLVFALLIVFGALAFIRWQKKKANHEVAQLSSQMQQLTAIQTNFNDMQDKLKKEKKEKLTKETESKKQVFDLAKQLNEAEQKLMQLSPGDAPLALHPLLKRTADIEMARLNQDRLDALEEMKQAMLIVEKLQKKQSSMLTSIRFAVGSDNQTMSLDQQITAIKSKMDRCAREMEDSQQRWSQIESLCGFAIISPQGVGQSRPGSTIGCIPMAMSNAFMAVPSAYSNAMSACTNNFSRKGNIGYARLESNVGSSISSAPGFLPVSSIGQRSLTTANFGVSDNLQTRLPRRNQASDYEQQIPKFGLNQIKRSRSGSAENLTNFPQDLRNRRPKLQEIQNSQSSEFQNSSEKSTPSGSENGNVVKKKGLFGFTKKHKEKK